MSRSILSMKGRQSLNCTLGAPRHVCRRSPSPRLPYAFPLAVPKAFRSHRVARRCAGSIVCCAPGDSAHRRMSRQSDLPASGSWTWDLKKSPFFDARPCINLLQSPTTCSKVYVLVFTTALGSPGVYSLRGLDDGLPGSIVKDTVVAFEDAEDAERFLHVLDVSMERHSPFVYGVPTGDLTKYCRDFGFQCRLEVQGSMLIPPGFTLIVTDWEKSNNLRDGLFAVLEADPQPSQSVGMVEGSSRGGHQATATRPSTFSALTCFQQPPSLDLEDARRRLELLLPSS